MQGRNKDINLPPRHGRHTWKLWSHPQQLEHVLRLEDDAGGDGVGDSDVVEEKKERM